MLLIKKIRRSYLQKLIFPALLLAVSLWVSSLLPWKSFFRPQVLNPLLPLTPVTPADTFCELTMPTLYYTGCDAVYGDRIAGYYYYSMHDDFCQLYLLPRTGSAAAPTLASYRLKGLIRNEQASLYQITNEMAESLQWSQRRILEMMNPYMLDAVAGSGTFYLLLYSLVPLCLAVSALGLLYFLYYALFPGRIPALLRCRKATGIPDIANFLEEEIEDRDTEGWGNLFLTEHFFICLKDGHLQFQPLADICWIYTLFLGPKGVNYGMPFGYTPFLGPKVKIPFRGIRYKIPLQDTLPTGHTRNTWVPFPFTKKREMCYFIWWTKNGKHFEVPIDNKDYGLMIMEAIEERHPEILQGFNGDNQEAAKKIMKEK